MHDQIHHLGPESAGWRPSASGAHPDSRRSGRLIGRFAAFAIAMSGLLLAAPATSLAAQGGITPEHWSGTAVHDGSGFDCTPYGGAFTQAYHVDETVSGMTTFDASGNPLRDMVHVGWRETDTREDTGASIDVRGDWTVTFDYAADTLAVTGAFRVGTAPSQGILIHDTGRLAFLPGGVFIAGPHDVFEDPDGSYCRALAALGA